MSEEDQVRRLLADARHDGPMPSDVAARMDRVLADLAQEHPAPALAPAPAPAPVADLDAARRRRRVRTLLVAAAVVVVAGIGIDQVRDVGPGAGSVSGASRDSLASDAGGAAADGPEVAEAPGGAGAAVPRNFAHTPVLDPDRFARQVARLRATGVHAYAAQDGDRDGTVTLPKPAGCPVPGRGHRVAVRYDGSAGMLVYRPVRGDTQVVDLYLCGQDEPTRSVTLPAR